MSKDLECFLILKKCPINIFGKHILKKGEGRSLERINRDTPGRNNTEVIISLGSKVDQTYKFLLYS